MAWTQHVMTCQVAYDRGATVTPHDGSRAIADCVAIVCVDDVTGRVAWGSHAPTSEDVAQRVNPSVPALDWRT